MTVPAGLAREQYAGSGSTGPFAFNHKTFVTSHLKVTKTVSGVDTLLVLTTNYTVSLASDFSSANIALIVALAVGETLTVALDPPVEQQIAYADNDPFPAATHERALDLATMVDQSLAEKFTRAPLLRSGSPVLNLVLPDPAASRILGWNAAATGLENKSLAAGSGVVFPSSSADNAVVRWDGVLGTAIQNSLAIISDLGDVSGVRHTAQTGYLDIAEIAAPASPAANAARVYAVDDGAGVTGMAYKDSAGNVVPWTNFLQSGTGAVTRTQLDKLRERVGVLDFSADATVTGAELQAAINSLPATGGVVYVPYNVTIDITDQNVTLPNNVSLVGGETVPGHINPASLTAFGPRINIGSTRKIILNNSSCVKGFLIFRDGLTFNITAAQVASTFVGTAIEFADTCTEQTVEDCIILGFEYAIRSAAAATNVSRSRIIRVNIDCINGMLLEDSFDVTYIDQVHCWPFVTVASTPETNSAHLKRSGSAIKVQGTSDWTKITNCFAFGYLRGFYVADSENVTLIGCSTDYPNVTGDGAIGFLVDGVAVETRLIGCQTAASQEHVYINTTAANGTVFLDGHNSWESKGHGAVLERGRLIMDGCVLRNTGGAAIGVEIVSTATEARIRNCQIKGFSTGIVGSAAIPTYQDGNDFSGTTTPVTNGFKPTVASAATLTLDAEAENFEVAGTVTITAIGPAAAYAGKVVALQFTGACQVTHNGTTVNLDGGHNFVSAAGDTLTLYSNGTNWYEVGRTSGVWTAYTPTVTPTAGAFTATSATGRWTRRGKTVHFTVQITITTVGTGTSPKFSLPFTGAAHRHTLVGREIALTGHVCHASVAASAGATDGILRYDNTDPVANGAIYVFTGSYEAA